MCRRSRYSTVCAWCGSHLLHRLSSLLSRTCLEKTFVFKSLMYVWISPIKRSGNIAYEKKKTKDKIFMYTFYLLVPLLKFCQICLPPLWHAMKFGINNFYWNLLWVSSITLSSLNVMLHLSDGPLSSCIPQNLVKINFFVNARFLWQRIEFWTKSQ